MLSICAICKNEEKNIVAFVNSWMPLCDEMIIVDTGSTDNTVKLANGLKYPREKLRIVKSVRQYDKSEQPTQDFADARNESIGYCAGDWILWADLDDRLDINSVDRIKTLISALPYKTAYAFQIASDIGEGKWSRFMQVRLFPAHPDVRFEGRVHEKLAPALIRNDIKVSYEADIIVAHLGYADIEVRKQKALRNLELLNMEEQSEETLIQCGDSFCVLDKWAMGLSCYRQAIAVSIRFNEIYDLLAEKMVRCYMLMQDYENAEKEIKNLESGSIEKEFWYGELSLIKGDNLKALYSFRAVEHGDCVMGERSTNASIYIDAARKRVKELESQRDQV